MARKNRIYSKSGVYHIIIRGNDRQNIFFDDNDKLLLLNRINKYSIELNIHIYAYCLMNNHVHLLIANANTFMSKFMLKLNTSYSRLFNIKYERSGHLFQGRYLSKPVEDNETCMSVIRYIIQNPEQAGLGKYNEYLWNSFNCVIHNKSIYREDFKPKIHIDIKFITELFEGIGNFTKFLSLKNQDSCMEYEGKISLNDYNCSLFIKKILKINNIYQINRMPINQLIKNLQKIKAKGISQNQIARITGISRKIISSA